MTLKLMKHKFITLGCILMILFGFLKIYELNSVVILPIALIGVISLYYGIFKLISNR